RRHRQRDRAVRRRADLWRDPHHGLRRLAQHLADEPRRGAAGADRLPAGRLVVDRRKAAGAMAIVLRATGLCKTFGAVTAAAEVSAAIEQDSVVGLIGTNGAGKTTFINMITGYLKPDRGAIAYEGRDITRLPPREITRLGICRSFQIPQLYGSLSVYDNMMVGIGILLRNAGLAGYFSRGRIWETRPVPGFDRSAHEVAEQLLSRFGLLEDRA